MRSLDWVCTLNALSKLGMAPALDSENIASALLFLLSFIFWFSGVIGSI